MLASIICIDEITSIEVKNDVSEYSIDQNKMRNEIHTCSVKVDDEYSYIIKIHRNSITPSIQKTKHRPGFFDMTYKISQDGRMYDICTGAGSRFVGHDPHFEHIADLVNTQAINQFLVKYEDAQHLRPVKVAG